MAVFDMAEKQGAGGPTVNVAGLQRGTVFEFRNAILLRELLGVGLACLILSRGLPPVFRLQDWLLVAFFVSNFPLRALGPVAFRWRAFDLVLITLDTAVVSLLIFYTGSAHLALLLFLVIFLVALGERLPAQLAAATALAAFDAWITLGASGGASTAVFLRVPFFYTVALYYGFFVSRVRAERREAEMVRNERGELRTLVKVLEDVTSSLDPRSVMRKVVAHVNEVMPAQRVSILLLNDDKRHATVLASTDDPELDSLELDLEKYPEIREAVRLRQTLLIEDASRHELLTPVRDQIRRLGFNSLVLLPLVFADEAIGTLVLRAASRRVEIDPEQYRFCRTVAAASANALKNALLHRRLVASAGTATANPERIARVS